MHRSGPFAHPPRPYARPRARGLVSAWLCAVAIIVGAALVMRGEIIESAAPIAGEAE